MFKQTQVNDKMNKCALDVATGSLVLPRDASKSNKYQCPQCEGKLILKKGAIMKPHFAHYSNGLCNYFGTTPGESALHKDAKSKLITHLKQFHTLNISFRCHHNRCLNSTNITISVDESDEIREEYRHPDGSYIADVAVLSNKIPKYIFEVRKTHSTTKQTRPEPWFEFQASSILDELNYTNPTLECIRSISRNCNICRIIQENPWLHQLPTYTTGTSCLICNESQYSPIYIEGSKQVCKICLGNIDQAQLKQLKEKYDITLGFLQKNLTRLKEITRLKQ